MKDINEFFPNRSFSFPITEKKDVSSKINNPLTANPTKWSNTLRQFVGCYLFKKISQFAKSRDYQIWQFLKNVQIFKFILNYLKHFSDAASVGSTGSDDLDQARILNLQEIIKPHPNLANRMYFV